MKIESSPQEASKNKKISYIIIAFGVVFLVLHTMTKDDGLFLAIGSFLNFIAVIVFIPATKTRSLELIDGSVVYEKGGNRRKYDLNVVTKIVLKGKDTVEIHARNMSPLKVSGLNNIEEFIDEVRRINPEVEFNER